MNKESCELRERKVTMRMTEAEYNRLNALYKKSTCRQLSEYLRKVVLQKPVRIKYWSESADVILSALFGIKDELNSIGNNFNQAVHKLHTLDRIPEFRSWINLYKNTGQMIEKKYREILERMSEIHRQSSTK